MEGIRASRAALVDRFRDRAQGPQTWRDFFSMDECRDLLFHTQEHRFTLPDIQRILDELDLEFLCFELPQAQTRDLFRQRFPEPGSGRSLTDWHAFETEHPNTFASMYQFWVRKPTRTP